jgi:hypothetical protein
VAERTALSPKVAAETIEAARDKADDERSNIEHAAALLETLGDYIGQPHVDRDTMEWQSLGLRVEYLARQFQQHCGSLGQALERIEKTAMGLALGGAQ